MMELPKKNLRNPKFSRINLENHLLQNDPKINLINNFLLLKYDLSAYERLTRMLQDKVLSSQKPSISITFVEFMTAVIPNEEHDRSTDVLESKWYIWPLTQDLLCLSLAKLWETKQDVHSFLLQSKKIFLSIYEPYIQMSEIQNQLINYDFCLQLLETSHSIEDFIWEIQNIFRYRRYRKIQDILNKIPTQKVTFYQHSKEETASLALDTLNETQITDIIYDIAQTQPSLDLESAVITELQNVTATLLFQGELEESVITCQDIQRVIQDSEFMGAYLARLDYQKYLPHAKEEILRYIDPSINLHSLQKWLNNTKRSHTFFEQEIASIAHLIKEYADEEGQIYMRGQTSPSLNDKITLWGQHPLSKEVKSLETSMRSLNYFFCIAASRKAPIYRQQLKTIVQLVKQHYEQLPEQPGQSAYFELLEYVLTEFANDPSEVGRLLQHILPLKSAAIGETLPLVLIYIPNQTSKDQVRQDLLHLAKLSLPAAFFCYQKSQLDNDTHLLKLILKSAYISLKQASTAVNDTTADLEKARTREDKTYFQNQRQQNLQYYLALKKNLEQTKPLLDKMILHPSSLWQRFWLWWAPNSLQQNYLIFKHKTQEIISHTRNQRPVNTRHQVASLNKIFTQMTQKS